MLFKFSDRIAGLAPSAIREILKATAKPGVIPFAAGNPAPEAFPAEDVRAITERLLRDRPVDCLQYGITEGYAPLRESLRADLKSRLGLGGSQDALLITSGAQQVVDLVAKTLCNHGDVVLTETPSFIGSLNTFRSYGAQLRGVPMQHDGMDVDALEALLKTEPRVKLIYTIPNFQNPTGATLSLAKRRRVLELAMQYGVPILEDNPYGDLRYEGEALPCLKAMDDDGWVIYAGSFSKILSPGLRVGFCLANVALSAKMTVGKQASDVHTTMLSQLIVHEWLRTCDVPGHVQSLCALYRRRRDLMCQGLQGSPLQFVPPQGGLFLWCELPPALAMLQATQAAAEQGVALVPGLAFLAEPTDACNAVRLNFSTPKESELQKGVAILRALFSSATQNL